VHMAESWKTSCALKVGACVPITKPVQYPPGYISSVASFHSIDGEQGCLQDHSLRIWC